MGPSAAGRSLPEATVNLAVLFVVSGTLCLHGAILPPTSATPRAANAVLAGVAALALVVLARHRHHPPVRLLHALLGTYTIGVGVSVSVAGTEAGKVAAGIAVVWVSLYAAVCLSRAAARAHTALGLTTLAVALHLSVGDRAAWSAFTVIAVSATAAMELLGRSHGSAQLLARTDPLTGTRNRLGLMEAGETLHRRMLRERSTATVVVLDLDDFKLVNDRYGHAVGDRVLVELTMQWRAQIRPGDVLGRVGGDEFVLLLPETDHRDAEALVARLRSVSTAAGWSYGIAPLSGDLEGSLARADADLYAAKSERRRAHASLLRQPGGRADVTAAGRPEG